MMQVLVEGVETLAMFQLDPYFFFVLVQPSREWCFAFELE